MLLVPLKVAGYEEYREQVEESARRNPYPFRKWFDDNGRAYIPFQSEESGFQSEESGISYDEDVVGVLSDEGCQVTDYRGGYCQQGKRVFRIHKILNLAKNKALQEAQARFQRGELYDLEREQAELAKFYDGVINQFISSSWRVGKGESGFFVIISQNPHDVASMSTDRGWTSCMELGEGGHYQDIFCEVAEGGLVAYLVRANDRDIQNPLARIAIKRFENKAGKSVALPENSVYGNEVPGFLDTVRQWLNERQEIDPGFYRRRGGEYSDTFSKSQLVGPSTPEDVTRWYRGEDPSAQFSTWTVTDNLYSSEVAWDEDDEEEVEFDTREEAEAYVDQRDYDDSWRDYYGGEWEEQDEDGNWENERFTITENAHDHRDNMKRDAMKTILAAPRGTYPIELIKEIKEELEFNNKYGNPGMNRMLELFRKNYPELMDQNDYYQMGARSYRSYINNLPEGPEKDQLKQEELNTALGYLNDPDQLVAEDAEIAEKLRALRTVTDVNSKVNLTDAISLRWSVAFGDKVLDPLGDLFKPIPENAVRNLVDFAYNIENIGLSNEGSPLVKKDKYNEQTVGRIAHTIGLSGADSPTVQKFYEWIIQRPDFGDNHMGRERNSSLNVETIGWLIAKLGENGRQFIPWAQQKLQEEQAYYDQLRSSERHQFYGHEHFERTAKKNVERWLYIIDALENGTGRSSKYRFS